MTKTNYSKDTELIDEEILDYDSLNFNETGINDGRMRLPTRYDISKYYVRNKRNRGKHRAGEYGKWKNKEAEDLIDFSNDFEWQITYAFPATLRNPVTKNGTVYGGMNVTFRRLYLILCEHFNGGVYFIDEYFDSVYPYTVKPEVDAKLSSVKEELLDVANYELNRAQALNFEEGLDKFKVNKDGTLNKSATKINRNARKTIDEYEQFAREWEENEGEEVAKRIKDDIIGCITSGQLPCQFASPADNTMKRRLEAGLSPTPLFSATEQLIRSLQLYVKIGGNKKWQTQSGLLV